jgi:6-phosphogluconate dehydrogenase
LRQVIVQAVQQKIAVAGLMSALGYLDAYTNAQMTVNLIQAQRDYFGAHTYQRMDKPGIFHTQWD